jgi:hypothetical protein
MTMVSEESMEVDTSEQRKSTDTSGSSTTARMPAHAMQPQSGGSALQCTVQVLVRSK